jgi:hypothetical protein
MDKKDIDEIVAAVIAAQDKNAAANDRAVAAQADHRKEVHWRIRLGVMVVVGGGVYTVTQVIHAHEFAFKGWELVVAACVDKLIFGIPEA